MHLQAEKVKDFIKKEKPYTISINYIPEDVSVDCVFVTNGKRYHDMIFTLKQSDAKILATSNVECRNGTFDYVINRAPLLETNTKIIDNSFLMLVKLLKEIGVKTIHCVGFDGYSETEDNYCNPSMEYYFVKQEASHLNYHMRKRIFEFRKDMTIHFITYSAYDAEEDINGASI
jgi:4-hydroxy 2-oxovalerate aldolase